MEQRRCEHPQRHPDQNCRAKPTRLFAIEFHSVIKARTAGYPHQLSQGCAVSSAPLSGEAICPLHTISACQPATPP
jgi:hypothetical protein